ncbi:hypothetical protein LCGC14_0707450 [marine sediment metagenome]|uniref:Uncharacterized protein n=1 Tax=marine sediment metagenome TaxID=412755 RepID=A0A0F9QKP7_9ZZZZ
MTQMRMAKEGKLTSEMSSILEKEPISEKKLIKGISTGKIVILPNKRRSNYHVGLGDGLKSKILCNTGTSTDSSSFSEILEIARDAEKYGASILCDQSSGPKFVEYRKQLLSATSLPIAFVPLYQNVEEGMRIYDDPIHFTTNDVIETFEEQILQGISAPGIHPITKSIIKKIESSSRLMPYISRGGAIISAWIKKTNEENPYIQNFDKILEICAKNDVPLTFVCATRAGCLADGFDNVQISEWKLIGSLVKKAHKKNVSVIVNGIGHLGIEKIPKAVQKLKNLTHNIPIGVMRPAITDRGLGFEHISHVIGATIAIQNGANYCQACCRTEHIGLPEKKDVIEALRTYKIALYAADLTKLPSLQQLDNQISIARCKNEWGKQLDLAIEPFIAKKTFKRVGPANMEKKGCSVCGELCPFKIINTPNEVN